MSGTGVMPTAALHLKRTLIVTEGRWFDRALDPTILHYVRRITPPNPACRPNDRPGATSKDAEIIGLDMSGDR
jgi:hypothetical protein